MATLPSASSSTRTSFCSRCADPLASSAASSRCSRCGFLGAEPKVRLSAPATGASSSAPKQDRWASRYVSGSLNLDDVPSSSSTSFKPSHQHRSSDTSMLGSRSPFQAGRDSLSGPSSQRYSHGYGYSPAIGMPSSISRDLRSSISSSTSLNSKSSISTASPTDGARPLKVGEAGPVVQESDGSLAKVFGTLVDGDSKPKWSCAGCRTIFARDATIYASPSAASAPNGGAVSPSARTGDAAGSYYCKACYSSRFALGICASAKCGKPVLGSTKEDGKYVKAGEAVYHGRCWRCQGCERGGGPPPYGDGCEIIVGMDGMPTCEDCFGKPVKRKPAAPPAPTSMPSPSLVGSQAGFRAPDVRRNSGLSAASRAGLTGLGPQRNAAMGATISELSKRFSSSATLNGPAPSPSPLSPALTGSRSPTRTEFAKPPMTWGNASAGDATRPRSSSRSNSAVTPTTVTPSGSAEMSHSNSGGTLSRSGSLSSSPGKPRPLIAQFTGDSFNLAAFRSTQAAPEGLVRSDSRSRSASPTKRSPTFGFGSASVRVPSAGSDEGDADTDGRKVAGTPSYEYGGATASSARIPWASRQTDPERGRTASGFPKPLNAPSQKEVNGAKSQQGEKPVGALDHDGDAGSGSDTRCTACGQTPFDGPAAKLGSSEVTMITLRSGEVLHSECFVCKICRKQIDAAMTFSRLDGEDTEEEGTRSIERYVHAACAPRAVLRRPTAATNGGLSPSATLSNLTAAQQEHYHATQQRMPNRSRDPSPAPPPVVHSFVQSSAQAQEERKRRESQGVPSEPPLGTKPRGIVASKPLGSAYPSTSSTPWNSSGSTTSSSANRQFRGSIGVAVPTRSVLNVHAQRPNPAAGIFSSSSSGVSAGGNGVTGLRTAAAPVPPETPNAHASSLQPLSDVPPSSNLDEASSASLPSAARRGFAPPKFGGMLSCAGCSLSLSVLESVPGPRGTSWHRACLRCGGRKPSSTSPYLGGVANAKEQRCGKQLDTAAKVDRDGQIRCRECFDREHARHAVAI